MSRVALSEFRRGESRLMFSEDYIQTLGVNFMEKAISIRNTEITFSVGANNSSCPEVKIWDLGGQREFVSMLPLVCNDAVAILFMFDLTRKTTLNSVKEWYRQARGFNKVSSNIGPLSLMLDCHPRLDWHQI
jgi:GTP-binding protein of the ras superfamily involved in termination of M-phase